MADGQSRIGSFLDAEDTASTLAAIEALGARVVRQAAAGPDAVGLRVEIQGVGLRGAASANVDVGNSGTLLRLLPGWLAGQPEGGEWSLAGDESIARRPVDRVADPLRELGAEVETGPGGLPPLQVRGAELEGARVTLPVASAQVKGCVLLAGLMADGRTTVVEPAPSRDHTERMLEGLGAPISVSAGQATVQGCEALAPFEVEVPGDFSSAAFWLVAALLVPDSKIDLVDVGLNPTRTGLLRVIERMGANFLVDERPSSNGLNEPCGSLGISSGGPLGGVTVDGVEVPLTIDELPLVALLGCFAEGETVVADAAELRVKESDRIESVVEGLRGLGAEIDARPDGFRVIGGGGLRGGMLEAHGDHRLAMVGAVAGLASDDGVTVRGWESAAVSYPGFERDLAALLGGPG